jgi:hypothetical protein
MAAVLETLMTNLTALLFAWLVIASSAHAQMNFELDNYAGRNHRLPDAVEPAFDEAGDPDCVYIPARFNMTAGDVVLSTDPNGIIYKLLSSLGHQHSHSGMATSDSALRHNTADDDAIDVVDNGIIPQRLKGTGNNSVRDAWPGMIDQTVEAATTTHEFLLTGGLVLYSSEDDPWESAEARAQQRTLALDHMARFQGYYSFYAYTDITWRDPFTKAFGDGNMCSGTLYHANRLSNNVGWVPENVRFYPAEVRQPAAQLLFDELYRTIRDKPDWLGEIAFAINGLAGTSLNEFATRAANQVVNCMAFNDCENGGSRWQDGVGDGSSLAPDDVLNLTYLYALVSAWYGDTMFVYNAVRPLEQTGSYYCCTGFNFGSYILDGFETLTCSGG